MLVKRKRLYMKHEDVRNNWGYGEWQVKIMDLNYIS